MRFFSIKKIFSPFWQLVFYLVLIPVLELFLMLFFFGKTLTLVIMLLSGLLGVFLAYREGKSFWIAICKKREREKILMEPALHLGLVIAAAFLTIVPGFLTSLFGLLLLFPLTRTLVVSYLRLHIESQRFRKSKDADSPDVIDV